MGTQSQSPQRDGATSPIFGPFLLWPNGWMHQDATWYGGRPRPRPHSARWGPCSRSPKGGRRCPKIFGPCLLWPNGWMDQDATSHEGRPQPRRLCVRWGPSPLPTKGVELPLQFSAHFYCGQTAGCIKMPLGVEVGLSPRDFVLDGDAAPHCRSPRAEPPNFRPMSIVVKRLDG